ncbi:hypothetical protein ACFTAO_29855 [Paenibacillus rhizoplanae]
MIFAEKVKSSGFQYAIVMSANEGLRREEVFLKAIYSFACLR